MRRKAPRKLVANVSSKPSAVTVYGKPGEGEGLVLPALGCITMFH